MRLTYRATFHVVMNQIKKSQLRLFRDFCHSSVLPTLFFQTLVRILSAFLPPPPFRKALTAEGGGAANSPDDWICATCGQLDTPCMSDMVTCDGPCLRSFHVVCLELGEDALSEERWLCEDCERGEHA